MTAVMKSVSPKIYEKVAKGDCTILVSKTAPKCEVPFKCYIYETKGKVIGEFICDKVFLLHPYTYDGGNADRESRKLIQTFEGSSRGNEILAATCLTQDEMFDYIGAGNYGYGWHISDLKIYDFPLTLDDFYLEKAPMSWRYVEEL